MIHLITISELTDLIRKQCHPCCERTAWNLVNKNPTIITRWRLGKKCVRFTATQALNLCTAILDGRAKR